MATNTHNTPVLSPGKLSHVVLGTGNFAPMVDWYKTTLGAHAVYENPGMSFLTYDEEHHRVAIGNFPDSVAPEDRDRVSGMHHIAFSYQNVRDLAKAYQQRKACGVVPFWCVNHGTTTSMYYSDPDGNRVEMQVDAFGTVEETNAYFTSTEFRENPIGVDFDPDEFVIRVESGEDERDILKRPNIGSRGLDTVPRPS